VHPVPAQSVPAQSTRDTGDVLLDVRDLTVGFRTPDGVANAVDGLSFTLRRGEVLGFAGESGSGKSVALASLLGLTRGDAAHIGGQVRFDGLDLVTASEAELRAVRGARIGMVFQNPMTSLNPVRRIGAQLGDALRLHGSRLDRKGRRARVVEVLDRVGIPDAARRADSYPHELSGGQQQRVGIALALMNDPDVIIADEPTTALDVTVQAQILAELLRVRDEFGVGVIIVTHDLGVLAEVADRVLVMYAGRAAELADVAELFDSPAHPYTLGLRRSLPEMGQRVERLTAIGGQPPVLGHRASGCAFHPRCPRAEDRCSADQPVMLAVGRAGHLSACHFRENPAGVREQVEEVTR